MHKNKTLQIKWFATHSIPGSVEARGWPTGSLLSMCRRLCSNGNPKNLATSSRDVQVCHQSPLSLVGMSLGLHKTIIPYSYEFCIYLYMYRCPSYPTFPCRTGRTVLGRLICTTLYWYIPGILQSHVGQVWRHICTTLYCYIPGVHPILQSHVGQVGQS